MGEKVIALDDLQEFLPCESRRYFFMRHDEPDPRFKDVCWDRMVKDDLEDAIEKALEKAVGKKYRVVVEIASDWFGEGDKSLYVGFAGDIYSEDGWKRMGWLIGGMVVHVDEELDEEDFVFSVSSAWVEKVHLEG